MTCRLVFFGSRQKLLPDLHGVLPEGRVLVPSLLLKLHEKLLQVHLLSARQARRPQLGDADLSLHLHDPMVDQVINKLENEMLLQVIMFCDNPKRELYILTRNEGGKFIRKPDVQKTLSFATLEAFPAKIR